MSNEKWFSAKLRLAIMVEPVGADTLNECVFLFRATDFDAAFHRAIAIGERAEQEYRNAEGKRVHWSFMEVISLDIVPAEELDGAEIYSEPIHLDKEKTIPYETRFNPRASKPTQTI